MASATLSRHPVASSVAVLSGTKLVQPSFKSRVQVNERRLATSVRAEVMTAERKPELPPDRAIVSSGDDQLEIVRVINGMWQTSGGWGKIEPGPAVDAMFRHVDAGFTTFDMADHCKLILFLIDNCTACSLFNSLGRVRILAILVSLLLQH